MMVFQILSILILVLIIIFLMKMRMKTKFSGKLGNWLFILYALLLVITAAIYGVTSPPGQKTEVLPSKVQAEKIPYLADMVLEGELEEKGAAYKKSDEQFDYTGKTIRASFNREYDDYVGVFLVKDGKANRVEITVYETPTIIMDRFDVSKQLPKITAQLKGNQLQFSQKPVEVNYRLYKEPDLLLHFIDAKQGNSLAKEESTITIGERVLLIRIPEHVTFEHDDTITLLNDEEKDTNS